MTARAEVGTCDACGQELILTADDCWHPWDVPAACPPESSRYLNGAEGLPFGDGPGRPGREHWKPAEA